MYLGCAYCPYFTMKKVQAIVKYGLIQTPVTIASGYLVVQTCRKIMNGRKNARKKLLTVAFTLL